MTRGLEWRWQHNWLENRIQGTVIAADNTAAPLSAVAISAYEAGNTSPSAVIKTTTDAQGKYLIEIAVKQGQRLVVRYSLRIERRCSAHFRPEQQLISLLT